ncbi:PP2C family protein-serine/threonine phosphatase [Demequina zhanjiangensis]|uniref:Protein phosphatase 2C domain-containing protein n=1 Tax=Demequina zhanjiangensis TaxID=3051659 RepID=A0ABT8FX54_9MICO|nr:protein phosphatase 2C domain-containing protein [Demequina sp. SYSU T00b26]MDN4471486.1 protein phosphatase 2C domain-containing protein [Demequina sp. SYSU T00b26]
MTLVTVGPVSLSVAGITDIGLVRSQNEDSLALDGPAFVVADGMGGYEAGDQASAAVVQAFRDHLSGTGYGTFDEVNGALLDADDRVAEVASHTTVGAGSTVTGTVVTEHEGKPYWLVFNVGDSRVYRHLGRELQQITVDHSLGRELVAMGQLAEEDLATFPQRNVITRAIGAEDSLADSWLVPVVNGERLLLCSDGLHGEVDDETIRAVLTMAGRPEDAASRLVNLAKEHGGRDNITVVVIDVLDGADDSLSEHTSRAQIEGTTNTRARRR